ncbi:energy-coupling factor ABC transporter ATP-binding protein [Pseudothermotoga sp.]
MGGSLTMSNLELTLIDVVFGYENGRRLFNGLNVTVRGGQLLLVYGPNGSGKSTLLKLMAGLLKPQSGSVLLNGTTLDHRSFREIGYVMQRAEDQFFCETVFDEIAFSARNFGLDNITERVRKAVLSVGLKDSVLEKSPFQLSEGEARRVAIACALVHEPVLLLFDEPLIGLDRIGKEMVRGILKSQKEAGKILVVTSHRSDNLRDLADLTLSL